MSAPDVTPLAYIKGYTFDSTTHLVKLGTQTGSTYQVIPELTDAEADGSTGDVRKLFWGLCQMMYQAANFVPDNTHPIGNTLNPRAEYDTDSSDPAVLAARKSNIMTATSFSTSNDNAVSTPTVPSATQTFTFTFKVVPTVIDVAPEV